MQKDGRDSFGEKRRKNSRRRFGDRALQNILSRNRPAGVTSSESISRAFNIARATMEKCRQAGRQCCLRDATRGVVRDEGTAGIDNRTTGKIPVENAREAPMLPRRERKRQEEGERERESKFANVNQTRLSLTSEMRRKEVEERHLG